MEVDGHSGEEDDASSGSQAVARIDRIEASLNQILSRLGSSRSNKPAAGKGGHNNGNKNPGKTHGLSDELATARYRAGLCVRCGQSGHFKSDCSNPANTTTPVSLDQKK